MKKRIISFAIVLVMIVVMVPAVLVSTSANSYSNGYVTGMVNPGAIEIDAEGTPDAAYLNSEKIISTLHYNNCNSSGETSSFYGYTAADTLGLYLWVRITDQSFDKADFVEEKLDEETGEYYDAYKCNAAGGDKLQLYIRAAGSMSSASRSIGAFEFDYLGQIAPTCVKYPKDYTNVNGEKVGYDVSLVDFETAVLEDEDAWICEAYIPWAAIGGDFVEMTIDDITNFQIGLQANNMKNDGSGAHRAYCYDTKFGTGYYLGISGGHGYSANASHQGTHCVPLSFAGFRSAVVATAPVVDGQMDDSYLKSEMIDAYVGGGGVKNFTAYTASTAEGFYIYADIIDDTLTKAGNIEVGTGDKFQVYFQMGDRFSNRDWGYVEMDYRAAEECTGTNNAVNYRVVTKSNWADNTSSFLNGIQHATTKKTDGSGWTAELFIPWGGRMTENNFDELTGTTLAIALQVNNYTDAGSMITYCLSDAFGGSAWVADGKSAYGNFYLAPVIFDFEADNGAKNIVRWANYSEEDLVLDGVMDDAYSVYASEKVDFTYIGTDGYMGYPKGWSDYSFATVYYAFTDTDVYMFVDVVDDTVANAPNEEFVSIFFGTSESIAKFALSPHNGGKFITNATYYGKTVSLPASNSNYAENDKIALAYKGTAGDYTGYTVEFKLPLTDIEKADLAAGKAAQIGVGLQTNNTNAAGTRDCYSYSVPYGNLWWQTGNDVLGFTALPKLRLDKTISPADFAVEPEITAAQVALGESITVNYFANLSAEDAANAKMQFTFNGTTTLVDAVATATANEYVFAFEGIAPQCMGDNIAASLIVNGEVVATKDNYSVYQNCLNVALADLSNTELIALVGNLGAYGAAAQVYANYKTDDLVNEGYEHFATAVESIDNSDRAITGSVEGAAITAAGVYFDNTNRVYVKVTVTDETVVENLSLTINGAAATPETNVGNVYTFYTEELTATEFDEVFTFVLSDGTDSQTVTYSVNAYCKAKLDAANPATAALAAATYAYGAAAEAYVA